MSWISRLCNSAFPKELSVNSFVSASFSCFSSNSATLSSHPKGAWQSSSSASLWSRSRKASSKRTPVRIPFRLLWLPSRPACVFCLYRAPIRLSTQLFSRALVLASAVRACVFEPSHYWLPRSFIESDRRSFDCATVPHVRVGRQHRECPSQALRLCKKRDRSKSTSKHAKLVSPIDRASHCVTSRLSNVLLVSTMLTMLLVLTMSTRLLANSRQF